MYGLCWWWNGVLGVVWKMVNVEHVDESESRTS